MDSYITIMFCYPVTRLEHPYSRN